MAISDLPIRRKLMRVFLLSTCAVLALTFIGFFLYELITFRHTMVSQLSMMGKVIARNSTAAVAFDMPGDAMEILSAVSADSHISEAALFEDAGALFVHYPDSVSPALHRLPPDTVGYAFGNGYLHGFEPVIQSGRRLGTLYLRSDVTAVYERLLLYLGIAGAVIAVALGGSYFMVRRLQEDISGPIVRLAGTARAVSDRHDYGVRAEKSSNDEIGLLTDAFNHMLATIEAQTKEITALNQRLEERVVERTRELQAAYRELEAFSYSVSHDLRAPLRSIHGYMNIFSEEYGGKVDDEGRRLIEVIIRNGRKMGQLIDDLLTFSQLGRKELRRTKLSMTDMVKDVWEQQKQSEDPSRQLELILRRLPTAIADAPTIRQVWVNLISNACKYAQRRERTVVEVGSLTESRKTVYFVRDNGAGFDMKYYDKLFGVFQRLHAEEEFSGTGVGLAIVERVIARHGGKIWAESTVDAGATFYFTLG